MHVSSFLPTDAPPPAYDSIFGKIKEIKKESEEKVGSCGDKTCKTCVTVCKYIFKILKCHSHKHLNLTNMHAEAPILCLLCLLKQPMEI